MFTFYTPIYLPLSLYACLSACLPACLPGLSMYVSAYLPAFLYTYTGFAIHDLNASVAFPLFSRTSCVDEGYPQREYLNLYVLHIYHRIDFQDHRR